MKEIKKSPQDFEYRDRKDTNKTKWASESHYWITHILSHSNLKFQFTTWYNTFSIQTFAENDKSKNKYK